MRRRCGSRGSSLPSHLRRSHPPVAPPSAARQGEAASRGQSAPPSALRWDGVWKPLRWDRVCKPWCAVEHTKSLLDGSPHHAAKSAWGPHTPTAELVAEMRVNISAAQRRDLLSLLAA